MLPLTLTYFSLSYVSYCTHNDVTLQHSSWCSGTKNPDLHYSLGSNSGERRFAFLPRPECQSYLLFFFSFGGLHKKLGTKGCIHPFSNYQFLCLAFNKSVTNPISGQKRIKRCACFHFFYPGLFSFLAYLLY